MLCKVIGLKVNLCSGFCKQKLVLMERGGREKIKVKGGRESDKGREKEMREEKRKDKEEREYPKAKQSGEESLGEVDRLGRNQS